MSTEGQNSVWQKTKTQHLIRYLPKGTFYAYFKVGGKPFRKSLRTDVYSVAKLRLGDHIAEQRELAEASANHAAGRLTFSDVVEQPIVVGGGSTEETQQPSQAPVQTTSGTERAEQLTFASLKWSGDIPPQKWMNFYTKVLSKFAGEKGLELRVEFKVAPDDGVSKQRLDETKAALQELGFSDDVETS